MLIFVPAPYLSSLSRVTDHVLSLVLARWLTVSVKDTVEPAAPCTFYCNCLSLLVQMSLFQSALLKSSKTHGECPNLQPQPWPRSPVPCYPHPSLLLGRLHSSSLPDSLCSEGSMTASFLLSCVIWIASLAAPKYSARQTPWSRGQPNGTYPCITPSPSPFSRCDVLEGEAFWLPSHPLADSKQLVLPDIPRCLDQVFVVPMTLFFS